MEKKVTVKNGEFVDSNGEKVTLCGINMVCKDKSLGYLGGYTKEDFAWLKEKGFNVIRLGLIWDGVEPEPGKYDEEYLKGIDKYIAYAAAEDIVVYLDMHQDLFGVKFCDGAPKWATLCDGCEHVETELWSEAYLLSPAVQKAFDNFWADAACEDGVGVRTRFVNMWKMLADRYKDNEYVIGYDFFNEPFPGTSGAMVMPAVFGKLSEDLGLSFEEVMGMWMSDEGKLSLLEKYSDEEAYKNLISSGDPAIYEFDKNVLSPFYKEITGAIREVDKKSLVFLEANYFCNTGIESAIDAVTDASGVKDPYQVYSPHGYDLLVDTDAYDVKGFGRLDVIFNTHKKVANRLGIPMLVGEWGCFPDANEAQVEQAKYIKALFKKLGASDTYFDFSHIKNNRVLEALN